MVDSDHWLLVEADLRRKFIKVYYSFKHKKFREVVIRYEKDLKYLVECMTKKEIEWTEGVKEMKCV
jgi:hypothetical protein